MKHKQWRFLLTEILEARNEANTQHAFIENRLAEMNVQLDALRRRLPPETYTVTSGGPNTAAPVYLPDKPWSEPVGSDYIDYANLRWRIQNEDGTWRDCID